MGDKVVSSSYAWLSGMWFFVDAKMHICGSGGAEDIVSCFQRTTNKINGDQECESTSTTHKDEDKTRLKFLIKAYKALNGDENKGIPKGDGTYYNFVADIPIKHQTCDFCRDTTSTTGRIVPMKMNGKWLLCDIVWSIVFFVIFSLL